MQKYFLYIYLYKMYSELPKNRSRCNIYVCVGFSCDKKC